MRAGYCAIIGPPNVGKSTFLNQVLGVKLAITSDKPQTTRHRLLGIHHEDGAQIAFLDTPGLHQGEKALNRRLQQTALDTLAEVDAALFLADVMPFHLEEARAALAPLAAGGPPMVLGLNKIDLVEPKELLLPMLAEVGAWHDWRAVVPFSALTGDGCQRVLAEIIPLLPEGPPLFPPDELTDLPMRFLCAELVREKVFQLAGQEVPYATAVTVDEFLEPAEEGRPTAISATIHVERPGQKAILIGKQGSMIKKIGTAARRDMEGLLEGPVYLNLFVRVEPDWSRDEKGLRKLGY